jgi:hypothetical protein
MFGWIRNIVLGCRGLTGVGAEVEIQGAFDGFAGFDLVFGADGVFEWGIEGWVRYQFIHGKFPYELTPFISDLTREMRWQLCTE